MFLFLEHILQKLFQTWKKFRDRHVVYISRLACGECFTLHCHLNVLISPWHSGLPIQGWRIQLRAVFTCYLFLPILFFPLLTYFLHGIGGSPPQRTWRTLAGRAACWGSSVGGEGAGAPPRGAHCQHRGPSPVCPPRPGCTSHREGAVAPLRPP